MVAVSLPTRPLLAGSLPERNGPGTEATRPEGEERCYSGRRWAPRPRTHRSTAVGLGEPHGRRTEHFDEPSAGFGRCHLGLRQLRRANRRLHPVVGEPPIDTDGTKEIRSFRWVLTHPDTS